MKKFLRVLRRIVLGLAFLVTLAALALVMDDWLGQREFRRALARADSAAPRPAPVRPAIPDATNFVATPLVRALVFADSRDPAAFDRVRSAAAKKDLFFVLHADWLHGRTASLREACRTAHRALPETAGERDAAELILRELEPVHADLDALVTAAETRPDVAFDTAKATQPGWIRLDGVHELSNVLALRADARLQLGRTDEAFGDCLAIMRLGQILSASPRFVHHALKNALFRNYALAIFWEGWSRGQWNEAQYRTFAQCFAQGETRHLLPGLILSDHKAWSQFLASLPLVSKQGPRGLVARKLAQAVDVNCEVAAAISAAGDRIDAQRVSRASGLVESRLDKVTPTNWELVLSNTSFVESMLDLAQVVCALEGHRLRTGSYPADLAAISAALPGGIPRDLFNGAPPHYRREPAADAAAFSLYFVGWNQRDEHGFSPEWSHYDRNILLKTGDWVWPHAARN